MIEYRFVTFKKQSTASNIGNIQTPCAKPTRNTSKSYNQYQLPTIIVIMDPSEPFPIQLHKMLECVHSSCSTHDEVQVMPIYWLPHGKAFVIINRDVFAINVLPMFFKATKYKSFQRKMNRCVCLVCMLLVMLAELMADVAHNSRPVLCYALVDGASALYARERTRVLTSMNTSFVGNCRTPWFVCIMQI